MKRMILSLAVAGFLLVSCENQAPKEQENTDATEVAAVEAPRALDINKFNEMADGLANQLIEIKGTCVHTCEHGGTKMFIVGEDPDFRVKIMATDESGNFNMEMEGNDYVVVGILDEYRVDNAELDKLEAEILSGDKDEEDMKHKTHEGGGKDDEHADHQGDGNDHDEDMQAQLDQINHLRTRLTESGKDHLSFWSIQAKSYKEVK